MTAKRSLVLLFVLLCLLPLTAPGRAAPDEAWQPAGVFVAADSAAQHNFGTAVALAGDTAVVGAGGWDSPTAKNVGAAYVFAHDGARWVEQKRLTAADGRPSDRFGARVALEGDTLAVSAIYAWRGVPGDPDFASTGAVYIFTGTGANWTERARLTPAGLSEGDLFGVSLDLDGDTLIAGAPRLYGSGTEAAYVFQRANGNWSAGQQLTAPDEAEHNFGAAVAVVGDVALVGAPGVGVVESVPPVEPGVVYIFARSGGVWSPAGTLTAPDGFVGDLFGCDVAYNGTLAVIRACHDADGTRLPGHVYVFVRNGTTWTPVAAPPRDAQLEFELDSMALVGDRLILGSAYARIESPTGRLFPFRWQGGAWLAEPPIAPDDDADDTRFGWNVAFNDEHLLAGASELSTPGAYARGGVYAFRTAATHFTLFAPVVAAPAR